MQLKAAKNNKVEVDRKLPDKEKNERTAKCTFCNNRQKVPLDSSHQEIAHTLLKRCQGPTLLAESKGRAYSREGAYSRKYFMLQTK